MERIKRMLAMFLSILMVFTIVPVQNFVWAMPNTGITFILTEDGGNKVIPESYELTISRDPDGKSILNGAVTAKGILKDGDMPEIKPHGIGRLTLDFEVPQKGKCYL